MIQHSPNWFMLLRQAMPWALVLALASAGNSKPARIAMMAITTRSSMRVNPQEFLLKDSRGDWARRSVIGDGIVQVGQRLQQIRRRGYCAFEGTVVWFSLAVTNPSEPNPDGLNITCGRENQAGAGRRCRRTHAARLTI